jgi:hypothetical protein
MSIRASWEEKYSTPDQKLQTIEKAMTVWPVGSSDLFGQLILGLDSIGQHETILKMVEK